MKIIPSKNKVLIRPINPGNEKTGIGLILIGNRKKKNNKAEIIAVSKESKLKIGTKIVFIEQLQQKVEKIDDSSVLTFLIINEDDIVATFEE